MTKDEFDRMVTEGTMLLQNAARELSEFSRIINVVARYQRNEMSSELAMHEIEMILIRENR